ncbi:hypothetical protein E2I00_016754 [Balaenoptera physalus]|uniref:Interleukin family protein n=1 Tax=Balaenoptera physalus TaxID=9770 RepID=A0A6A1Q981_BALPH|nr:hypothetical protein E2I00_016754 [Balaenoptera physalus]
MSSSIYSLQVPAAPGLSCWAITMGLGWGENKGAKTCSTNSYSDPEQAPEAFSSLFLSNSCGLQNLAPESPVVSRMKGSGLPLCLLSAVFYLFWTPSARQPKDEIIDLRILRTTQPLQDTKPAGQCCLLCHILRLYLDKVFKNYQTPDHRILQKISGLANSFLTIKKDLWLCHAHMTCPCGEEAMEKYSQLMSHFQEVYAILALLQPQAAVVKALGELDILLSWMEEMD